MEPDQIALVNQKSIDQFKKDYLHSSEKWDAFIHPKSSKQYSVTLHSASSLSLDDFEACFKLIEFTSSEDYKKSKDGWKPKSKRKEMKLLDLKYFLVKLDGHVEGFLSFMPTHEDGRPVIYCYEIHLAPVLQGTGLAKLLMEMLESISSKISCTEKVMLTSYLSNDRAVRFYHKLGYSRDEHSPPARMLRDGTRIEPAYIILSKSVLHS